jgi:hypothetical protein
MVADAQSLPDPKRSSMTEKLEPFVCMAVYHAVVELFPGLSGLDRLHKDNFIGPCAVRKSWSSEVVD